MFPPSLASKLSPYNVSFGEAKVNVHVIDDHRNHSALALARLSNFKRHLSDRRVVGLSLGICGSPKWLILCVGRLCLIIKLLMERENYIYQTSKDMCLTDPFLRGLNTFLSDRTICFVNMNSLNCRSIRQLRDVMGIECKTFVEVGYLVARVRKNPGIILKSLKKLGVEVGLDVMPRNNLRTFSWNSEVFSKEEIEFAIHDAYYSYLIGEKLLAGKL